MGSSPNGGDRSTLLEALLALLPSSGTQVLQELSCPWAVHAPVRKLPRFS
jgi:hypothetical protein